MRSDVYIPDVQGRLHSCLGQSSLVLEGLVTVTVGLVELGLEFDPMKTESVQEALQHIHTQQDSGSDGPPDTAGEVDLDGSDDGVHIRGDASQNGFLEEDEGQLLMRKRQGPETEVGGGVGHGTKDVLDGFDGLVDDDLTEFELFFVLLILDEVLLQIVLGGLGLALGLVHGKLDEGLGEPHDRDANDADQHERRGDVGGAIPHGSLVGLAETHANQRVNDGGHGVDRVHPLVHD